MKIFFALPETSTGEPQLLETEGPNYAAAKELMMEKILDELETAFGPQNTLGDDTWPEDGSQLPCSQTHPLRPLARSRT